MRKAQDGAARARPEEYSYLDDVPHCIKRARTLAAVSDPVVVKFFKMKGEFDGECWACSAYAESLVCASCLAAYEEALESSQVCMELKADTTANR